MSGLEHRPTCTHFPPIRYEIENSQLDRHKERQIGSPSIDVSYDRVITFLEKNITPDGAPDLSKTKKNAVSQYPCAQQDSLHT